MNRIPLCVQIEVDVQRELRRRDRRRQRFALWFLGLAYVALIVVAVLR